MIFSNARMLAACAIVAVAFSTAANADDCKLGRVASLDFAEDGAIVIPASIEGTSVRLLVDTGGIASAVDPVVAGNLHLVQRRIMQGLLYDAAGDPFTYIAVLHDLGLGEMHAADVHFLVWPQPSFSRNELGGTLGADLLRNYDVEIDFAAHKLNLFSQDHCPGKVVYWGSNNVAVVPMHVVNSGHIIVPVELDGHQIDAILDTGATYSILSAEVANNVFALTPNSPDVVKAGDINGAVQTTAYRHTFKTLSLDGLAIGNPSLIIFENLIKYTANQAPATGSRLGATSESGGVTDLTLGLAELRHLHLYIAYKEQKLYISPASETSTASAGAGPATGATVSH